MRLHFMSLDPSPFRIHPDTSSPKLLDPPSVAEIKTLTCSGCGKMGVSICARCSKKPGYKTALARAHPLQERDPKLYKRLDELSRSPLRENKELWDEFCIEIKAGSYYEHLPILFEILQEGKWRTDSLYPMRWLRENFARRVKRVSPQEDYGPTGKRLPGGPKIDKRNGAVTALSFRPFAEFESEVGGDGDIIPAIEVLEGRIARKELETSGGQEYLWESRDQSAATSPLDGNSARLNCAELGASDCNRLADALKRDRRVFEKHWQ